MRELRSFRLDDRGLALLDQRALPEHTEWLWLDDVEGVAQAIETLAVRGAPAIGGAAAAGMVLAARRVKDRALLEDTLRAADARLRKTRPTAVNLFHALDRMKGATERALASSLSPDAVASALEAECRHYLEEDEAMCAAIGVNGASLFEDGDVVLTVCHTGALATCGQGTALGVLKSAHASGKRIRVLALETRPLLQGARLTAWECEQVGLPVCLLTDGMAAFAMARLGVTKAIAGADRIATNGDVANKIGTYGLATACHAHGVPFFVAAPSSTLDAACRSGDDILIEERHPDEIRRLRDSKVAPAGVPVWNPAFDVTPHRLVDAIITEHDIHRAPYRF